MSKVNSGQTLITQQVGYDPLGRPTVTSTAGNGIQPPQSGTRALIRDAGGSLLMEVRMDDAGETIRSNFLSGPLPGEVLAVDVQGQTLWGLPDAAGTVRSYVAVAQVNNSPQWQILHRAFDEFGKPAEPIDGGNAAAWKEYAPVIWQGSLQVPALGYHVAGRWLDSQLHSLLSDGGGLSGYRLGNNAPTATVKATRTYSEGGAVSSGPDAYGSGFWAGKNRLLGEGVRGILGDEYLVNASMTELSLLTVGVVTAGVLTGGAALAAASWAGVGLLGSSIIAGAAGGGVEYAAWVGGSNIGSFVGGRNDGASFDAGHFVGHAAGGAVGGAGGFLVAKGASVAGRQIYQGAARALSRNGANVAPRATVDLMAESGQLGGKLYGPEKLAKLQRYLERRGIYLDPARNGGFDGVNVTGLFDVVVLAEL